MLPSLGNRIRGRIIYAPSTRLVWEALERQRVDRLAAEAVELASKLAESEEKKDE